MTAWIAYPPDLGQDLFQPPNVKGWDEGLAWITTSTFMMRGNIAGAIVGAVDVETLRADATDMMEMSGAMDEMGPMTGKQKRRAEGQQIKRYEVAGLASTLRKASRWPSRGQARRRLRHEPKPPAREEGRLPSGSRPSPLSGSGGGTRTRDLRVMNPVL